MRKITETNGFFSSMPLFFKIWFLMIVGFIFGILYFMISIILNPEGIGRFFGLIVKGFQNT